MTRLLMRISASLIAVAELLASASCSDDNQAESQPMHIIWSEAESRVALSANDIAYELFCHLYSVDDKSLVFSPFSSQMAMAALANGASGATLEEFQSLLFPGASLDDLNSYYNKLCTTLPSTDRSSRVAIANSLWYSDDLSLNPDYEQSIADVFGASSYAFRLADKQGATLRINNWISDATDGKIRDLLSSDKVGTFNLVNALYFKSEWTNKFDKSKTNTDVFYNIDDTKSAVRFMNGEFPIKIGSVDGNSEAALVAELPFGNDAFRMVFIKPGEGENPLQALKQVHQQGSAFLENLKEYDIKLRIPRFEARTQIEIQEVLSALGFENVMGEQADYSNLCSNHAFAKKMIQECCIEVDEEGATAATSSSVSGDLLAPPPRYFILDHPFAYMIRETTSGTILFMGAVNRM